ncbi:hypothetical protein [Amycolatopsis sp. lyj-90]|uniref:hypothetical protein n=1 Tax=Amycolatopsis sp. lyj-90 TaxID=2789285 RepID=UPI00397C6D92
MYLGDTGLLPGESLLWEGAPRRVPLVATSDLAVVPGLLFLGFLLYPAPRNPVSRIVYVVPAMILLLWIGKGIKRYLRARTRSFVVTDRRVVVRHKGADVLSRYLSDLGPRDSRSTREEPAPSPSATACLPVSWEVRETAMPSRRFRSWPASRTRAASST